MTHHAGAKRPDLSVPSNQTAPKRLRKWFPGKHMLSNQDALIAIENHARDTARDSLGEAEGAAVAVPVYIATVTGAGITIAMGATTPIVMLTALAGGIYGGVFGLLCARQIKKYYENHME